MVRIKIQAFNPEKVLAGDLPLKEGRLSIRKDTTLGLDPSRISCRGGDQDSGRPASFRRSCPFRRSGYRP